MEKLEQLKQNFEEAFDLLESIKPYSNNMPISLREQLENFLKKNSEEIYGIKDFLNE